MVVDFKHCHPRNDIGTRTMQMIELNSTLALNSVKSSPSAQIAYPLWRAKCTRGVLESTVDSERVAESARARKSIVV